jgi:aquaporin Z
MGETMLKNCVSEFIGTYLLVLTVGCNVIGGSSTWAALSIASSLMVGIYSLGSVSGANFNPAVSLALFLAGEMDASKMGIYMATQVVGGICASLTYLWLQGSAFNLAPGAGFGGMGAAVVEIAYTFMLCFVVLRAAVSKMNPADNEYFGLAIGFVIVAGGYAGGWISGGAFNPAVAIGIDVASAGQGVYWCLLYTVYEFIGAALAAGAHMIVEDSSSAGKMVKQFVSEFIGTFFLVFTVGLNVLGSSPAPALSIGASLMCMIYALGGVSGAHFNPAVTVALTLAGKSPAGDIPHYMAAQLLGGLAASLAYTGLVGKAVPLQPGAGHSWSDAAFAEILYTFVLCFVVLNVATLSGQHLTNGGKAKQIYGLAIGFCIVVGGYAIGGVSGGSLNPAVSFALDTSNATKGGAWMNCIPYTCFEIVGAAAAAGAFFVTRDEEFTKGAMQPINKKEDGYGAI